MCLCIEGLCKRLECISFYPSDSYAYFGSNDLRMICFVYMTSLFRVNIFVVFELACVIAFWLVVSLDLIRRLLASCFVANTQIVLNTCLIASRNSGETLTMSRS